MEFQVDSLTQQKTLYSSQHLGNPKGFRSSMPNKDQICSSCHKLQYHTLSFLLLQEVCNFQKSHSAWGDHMKQWKDQHSNLCSTGNSTQDSVIDYKEKESKKEWIHICICVTDSLCSTAETRQCCKSVIQFSSVQSLRRVRLLVTPWTAARQPPCPSPTPGACSSSCSLSWWCHPPISSSVVPFSSCLQSFPASGSFPMSQFFASGGQNTRASAYAPIKKKKNVSIPSLWTAGPDGYLPLFQVILDS